MRRFWITRYALGRGVSIVDCHEDDTGSTHCYKDGRMQIMVSGTSYLGLDAFDTKEGAKKRVLHLIELELNKLERRKEKLLEMKVNIIEKGELPKDKFPERLSDAIGNK